MLILSKELKDHLRLLTLRCSFDNMIPELDCPAMAVSETLHLRGASFPPPIAGSAGTYAT